MRFIPRAEAIMAAISRELTAPGAQPPPLALRRLLASG